MKTKNNWKHMAGTEGTGTYIVVARTVRGRLGYRDLGHAIRVRVEPRSEKTVLPIGLRLGDSWKKPGDNGQFRFSIVVSRKDLPKILETAAVALGVRRFRTELNKTAPTKSRRVVNETAHRAELR